MLRQFLAWIESGEKTAVELLALCLERIERLEPELRAWVEVSPQAPLAAGPLGGIPFGAKDIFETRDLKTEFGSPLYAGRKGECDAALVTDLRRRGAVLVGKTETTAFAYFDPAPTRNPRNREHTPGGSSSGSAAAVAAGMVPFALGSQTQGSVVRPASFCGVAGFKPTRALLPLDGVLPFAPSLDTAGLFTQTADDMRLLWERMGFARGAAAGVRLAAPASLPELDPEMERVFGLTVERLGAELVELPPGFFDLHRAARTVNDYEGARTHEQRWRQHGERIGAKLAQLVQNGLAMPETAYSDALRRIAAMKRQLEPLWQRFGVILTPAAPGPAPAGLSSTGDPRMNSPWTALGVPAISVPMPVEGLPLGLQLTTPEGQDGMLLEVAAAVEGAMRS